MRAAQRTRAVRPSDTPGSTGTFQRRAVRMAGPTPVARSARASSGEVGEGLQGRLFLVALVRVLVVVAAGRALARLAVGLVEQAPEGAGGPVVAADQAWTRHRSDGSVGAGQGSPPWSGPRV